MDPSPADVLLNHLVSQEGSYVLDCLNRWEQGTYLIPDDFWWPGLAVMGEQYAEYMPTRADTKPPNLEWAEVAVRIYEWLEQLGRYEQIGLAAWPDYLMHKALNLRLRMVKKLGVIPGHRVLDVDSILNWFYNKPRPPFLEIRTLLSSKKRSTYTGEEYLLARDLATELGIIATLVDWGLIFDDPSVRKWLDLEPLLTRDYIDRLENE